MLDALAREGVDIRSHAAIVRVEAAGAKLNVVIRAGDGEETIAGSHVLVATGRTANTEGLGLEQAGIACDRRGIVVDAGLKTTNKRVYAIGDVAGLDNSPTSPTTRPGSSSATRCFACRRR